MSDVAELSRGVELAIDAMPSDSPAARALRKVIIERPDMRHSIASGLFDYLTEHEPGANGGPPCKTLRMLSDIELEKRPKPAQLVEGVLLAQSHAVIWGPPEAGKGFCAIDLLGHIRLGLPWHGHAVKQVGCVYLALERQAGLGARVRAWKAYHGVEGLLGIYFPEAITLFERGNVDTLLAALDTLPEAPGIIVIDTHGRAILPGDENGTQDNGTFNENIDRIRHLTGACVLEIHHGNAGGERERGHTALRADADTMIRARVEDADRHLVCDKQSELDHFEPLSYRIVPHLDSALAIDCAKNPLHTWGRVQSQKERDLLSAFALVQKDERASNSAWKEAAGLPARTYYHVRKALQDTGYVKEDGRLWKLTDLGRRTVQP